MPFGSLGQRGATECNALIDRAIIAHLGCFTDDNAKAMINKYPASNNCTGMDFYPCEKTRYVGGESSEPIPLVTPEKMGPTMHHNSVQARITGQHFPGAFSGRVALHDILNVFSESAKHGIQSEK